MAEFPYLLCETRVHPRIRGADSRISGTDIVVFGSSPCVRGRLFVSKNPNGRYRFIPVYTGQMFYRRILALKIQPHPRVYGADALMTTILE